MRHRTPLTLSGVFPVCGAFPTALEKQSRPLPRTEHDVKPTEKCQTDIYGRIDRYRGVDIHYATS